MKQVLLVVDTDLGVSGLIADAVAGREVDVVCADNHDQAVHRFIETGPDLMFIDLMVPPHGGLTLLRRIRGLEGGKDVPAFLLSVLSRDADVRRVGVSQLGALDLLRKPLQKDVIRARLSRVLDRAPKDASPILSTFGPPDGIEQGDFEGVVSPLVLRSLALRQATGCLRLKSLRKEKVLFFREGAITFALSNDFKETLGQDLLAQGKIDENALRAAQEAMKREGKKLGEFLVERRLLHLGDVLESIRQNVLAKVLDVFTWSAGEFRLSPYRDPPAPLPGRTLEVQQVLWDGLNGPFPLERLLASLEPYSGQILASRRDLQSFGEEVPLNRDNLKALRSLRVLAGRPLADVISEVREEGQVRLLYYLLVQGYMTLEGQQRVRTGARAPGGSPVHEARLRLEALKGKNHFQVLQVPVDATDEGVHRAYLRMAKEAHPDVLGAEAAGELQQIYQETFRVVQSAFEAIKTEPLRRNYRQSLLAEGRPQAPTDASTILRAEQVFREGEVLARLRDWPRAAAAFRQALDLNPEEGEYALNLGIALLGMGGNGSEKHLHEAEELFETARRLMPTSPEPSYRLGRLALRRGDVEAATAHFRTSLERSPEHLGAARELRLLKARVDKRENGFLGGLLRKKATG